MSQEPQDTPPIRILLLDDNPSTRSLAKLALERHLPCSVELCADPKALLATAAARQPDLFLLDVSLPDGSGSGRTSRAYRPARRGPSKSPG